MAKKEDGNKEVDALIKDLEKEFGAGTVFRQTSAAVADVDVISTGSYSLDKAIGVGGLPRGRIVEIFGPESGGKTTLCLSIVAQAQKAGGLCAYIDVENALDLNYAKRIGVDINALLVSQPDSAEQALNIADRLIKSKKLAVVVIDSVAALRPNAEAEGDIGSMQIGLQARMMSSALRNMGSIIKKTNTLAIFINQIRMKIGTVAWGNPETTPGGRALGFYSSVRLDIRRIATLKEGEDPVGIQVKAKVVKNKVAPPFKTAEFAIIFGEGISLEADMFGVALGRDIIEKKGNTYYFGDEKLGVGMKNGIQALKENAELLEQIKTKLNKNVES